MQGNEKGTRRILRSSQDWSLDSLNSGQMFSPTEPLALKERIDDISIAGALALEERI